MKTDKNVGLMQLGARALVGAFLGLMASMLLLLGFAAVMSSGAGSEELTDEYVILSAIAGATIAGIICSKGREGGVVASGLISAAAYIMLLMIGSLLVPSGDNSGSLLLKNIIAAVVGGIFGGVLSLYRKTKKSKKRR